MRSNKGVFIGVKNRKGAGVIIFIASLLFVIILMNVWMVFIRTREQTRTSGIYELENISGDFEEMISNAEKLTMQIAIGAREHLDDPEGLEKYIYEKRAEVIAGDVGAFNVYIAGDDWAILPGLENPESFEPSERMWYRGAILKNGMTYVTAPYQDVVTGKICYTVSVMLGDHSTVLSVDYTVDTIQAHIGQMYESDSHDAVIVTDEGIIAGCSDETLIGQNLVSALPEYAGIWSLSKNTEGVASARIKSDFLSENLFATRAGNGWYFIISISDWELYSNAYIQLVITVLLSLALFMTMVLLYIEALKNRKRIEDSMTAREEFLTNIVERLRDPLKRILNITERENVRHIEDFEGELNRVHSEADALSEMIEQIASYTGIVRTERSKKEKGGIEFRQVDKRYRLIILVFMIFVMIINFTLNLTISLKRGNTQMKEKAETYVYELSEWMDTQKSILDMFVSIISTNPELLEDYDGAIEYLDRITQQYPEISVTYMTSPDLKPEVYMNNGWLPDEDFDLESRPWYKATISSKNGWSISEPYYDSQTGGYCVTMSEAVYDARTGEFMGIFGIDFFMDKLVEILGDSYSDDSYAFLADTSGYIINHPYGSYQMTEDSMTSVLELPYGRVKTDGSDTVLIRDYDSALKTLIAIHNEAPGFTVYAVSDIWAVYGYVFLYGMICIITFVICIIMIYRLLSDMIAWQDAASRKLKEAADTAVAAGKAKGHFLARMSHEIRTPINTVLGMNEMILRESDDNTIRDYSESIDIAGKSLLSLINDILDFTKIEDGKMEIIPVRYRMSSMITALVTSVHERAMAKGLEFIIKADPDLPSELFGDEVRIRQVITNILTNAVKYTETGSITFSIGYKKINDDADSILLNVEVKDTGIGIKEDDLKKLFSEFERIDEERNRNVEGTGLGMSITKNLLEMMGTSLNVDSIYGEGSRFYFSLRQQVTDFEPMGDYETAYHELIRERKKYTEKFTAPDAAVLVVDDNTMNRMVLRSLLKKTMVQIDEADAGDDGLAHTRDKKYDIIFLDHMMPVKDGIETLKELRSQPDNPNIGTPVICLTANAISGARKEYISAGFDDYLTKPVDSGKLEDMLIDYLPDEKIKRNDPGSGTIQDEDPHLQELEVLKDQDRIDYRTGLQRSGSSDDYYDLLKVFYETMDDRSSELNGFAENGDIENYTIAIHSMKSSLRIIGAFELGDKAEKLEKAGKSDDAEYIKSHHSGFIEELAGLNEILSPVFKKAEENSEASDDGKVRPEAGADMIKQAYDEIRSACDGLDTDRIEDVINRMKEYRVPDDERVLFEKIDKAASQFDYEMIINLLPPDPHQAE